MQQYEYQLLWNSHDPYVTSSLGAFQQNGDFVDMTLAAAGYFVKAHKMVISLGSQYLKELIQSSPSQHPIIFLNGVNHKQLLLILEYIYTGHCTVPSDDLQAFLSLGKALHLKGLEIVNDKDCNAVRVSKRANKDIEPVCEASEEDVETKDTGDNRIDNQITFSQPIDCQINNRETSDQPIDYRLDNQNTLNQPIEFSVNKQKTSNQPIDNTSNDTIIENLASSVHMSRFPPIASKLESLSRLQPIVEPQTQPIVAASIVIDRVESGKRIAVTKFTNTTENNIYETNPVHDALPDLMAIDDGYVEPVDNSDVSLYNNDRRVFDSFSKVDAEPIKETATGNLKKSLMEELSGKVNLEEFRPKYTVTKRGAPQMILNRYLYNIHHKAKCGLKRRWRCVDYRRKNCKAFFDSMGDVLEKRSFSHVHPFHDKKILKAQKSQRIFDSVTEIAEKQLAKESGPYERVPYDDSDSD